MGKNGLSGNELLGLVVLAVIIIAVTATGIVMKEAEKGKLPPEEAFKEATLLENSIDSLDDNLKTPAKRYKNRKKKKSSGKRTSGGGYIERDPFKDTIPVD